MNTLGFISWGLLSSGGETGETIIIREVPVYIHDASGDTGTMLSSLLSRTSEARNSRKLLDALRQRKIDRSLLDQLRR